MALAATSKVGVGPGVKTLAQRSSTNEPIIPDYASGRVTGGEKARETDSVSETGVCNFAL